LDAIIEFLIPISVISLLILLNALFVAAEFAIVGAPHTRIAQRAQEGSIVAQRVREILQNTDLQNRYLAVAQVGISIASLGLGMYGEHTIADWLVVPLERLGSLASPAAHSIAAFLSIGLLTYLHVVIGEMVPKSIALQSAESTVLRLQRPMAVMDKIFLPIVWVLNGLGNAIIQGTEARLSGKQFVEPGPKPLPLFQARGLTIRQQLVVVVPELPPKLLHELPVMLHVRRHLLVVPALMHPTQRQFFRHQHELGGIVAQKQLHYRKP